MYYNEMKVSFLSKSTNESFARVTVAAFLAQLDPTIDQLADIKTAVSEAVTNAIIHGYRDTEGMVHLSCQVEEDTVTITVSDEGQGISDIHKAREPLYSTHPEEERCGMGFTVMETFMDEVTVQSEMGKGTTITMKKCLDEASE